MAPVLHTDVCMKIMRVVGLFCLLSLAGGSSWADQGQTALTTPCSLTRCTPSEARYAKRSMVELQRSKRIPANLLKELANNQTARPFLPRALNALRKVDGMPGTQDVVLRLAHAHDEGSARGAAFEIFAGAVLRKHLKRLSTVVKGNEWDGELRDGTVVSMKSITTPNPKGIANVLRHATKQLIRRTQDGRPAMLVIGHEPGAQIRKNWRHMANRLGSDLSVVLLQQKTGKYRTIFTTLGRNPLAQQRTRRLRPVNKQPARRPLKSRPQNRLRRLR